MAGGYIDAIVGGRKYSIPERWITGYRYVHQCSAGHAIRMFDYTARIHEGGSGEITPPPRPRPDFPAPGKPRTPSMVLITNRDPAQ